MFVVQRSFRRVRRGYDPDEVDRHLEVVSQWFTSIDVGRAFTHQRAELEERGRAVAGGQGPGSDASAEAETLLAEARAATGRELTAARQEREQRLAAARAEAAQLIERSRAQADGARVTASGRRTHPMRGYGTRVRILHD
jgi:DivIVA domain-containing protein